MVDQRVTISKMQHLIDSLRAELADVRAQWAADVGSAIARAQTAEARAEQYENGRWHSYETVQAIVKEREELRAEAARLRDMFEMAVKTAEDFSWLGTEREFLSGWEAEQTAEQIARDIAALRGPAQSEQPAARRQEANDDN